jgi:peroxiredoxin
MTIRQQWLVVAAVLGGLAVFLGVGTLAFRAEASPVDVGSTAPPFKAHVLGSSAMRTLADYKGQVVLLNLWGTFCPPCTAEMPSLERLHRLYAQDGLKIVAVSIDQDVGDSSITAYARNLGLTFEILHDSTRAIAEHYLVNGWPESFVIDRTGKIRRKAWGADLWDSQGNRALIAQLLGVPVRDSLPHSAIGDTALHPGR